MNVHPPSLLAASTTQEALSFIDQVTRWLLTSGLSIALIILVAVVARVVAGIIVNRIFRTMFDSGARVSKMTNVVVRRTTDTAVLKAQQDRRQQRADTLAQVAKTIAGVTITAIACVMVLSELNIDIAPIIASLGVAGLAAGIGAQTIIKDVIAGIVMLFEDVVAVGDYVDLQYAEGTVEHINLRVTQVRALNGSLWTVRNGEIISIGNFSRDYGTAFVVLDIDNGADDDEVTAAFDTVLADVVSDPLIGPKLLATPSVTGILTMDGARYQRRVTADTLPGAQWDVERALRKRIRIEFTRRGIGFALPRFQETGQ